MKIIRKDDKPFYLIFIIILVNLTSCHHDTLFQCNVTKVRASCDTSCSFPEIDVHYEVVSCTKDTFDIIENYSNPKSSHYKIEWGLPLENIFLVIDNDTLYGRHSYLSDSLNINMDTIQIRGNKKEEVLTIPAFEIWDLYDGKYKSKYRSIHEFLENIGNNGYFVYETMDLEHNREFENVRINREIEFNSYEPPVNLFEDDF